MAFMGDAARIGVWASVEQAPYVRAVAEQGGVTVALAGSPVRGQAGQVAQMLEATAFDDLRAAAVEADVALLWLAAPAQFGAGEDDSDARWVLSMQQRGVRIVSSEPIPASALVLRRAGWTAAAGEAPGAGDALRFIALPRVSPALREAPETLAAFGPARAVQIEAWAAPMHMTLGGRLFGAMDLVYALLGEPETVDAAYVGPHATAGLHALPGETLRDLAGDLLGTLRFADGRACVLSASNAAGRWNTLVTLISPAGRLRIFDDGWEWIAPDGTKRDEHRRGKRGAKAQPDHAVTAAADSLARLLDPRLPDDGPTPLEPVLAMSQAALLSARTGQPESPGTLRRLLGGT